MESLATNNSVENVKNNNGRLEKLRGFEARFKYAAKVATLIFGLLAGGGDAKAQSSDYNEAVPKLSQREGYASRESFGIYLGQALEMQVAQEIERIEEDYTNKIQELISKNTLTEEVLESLISQKTLDSLGVLFNRDVTLLPVMVDSLYRRDYPRALVGFRSLDKARQWLIDHYNSVEFRYRAYQEGFSSADINEFIRRISAYKEVLNLDARVRVLDEDGLDPGTKNYGLLIINKNTIAVDVNLSPGTIESIAVHEGEHATKYNESQDKFDVSARAREFYEDIFTKLPSTAKGKDYVKYLRLYYELESRRRQYIHYAERYTNWKYGQEFTEDRFLEVWNLIQQDKEAQVLKDLIDMIKGEAVDGLNEGEKKFINMINTLAANDPLEIDNNNNKENLA